MFDLASPVAWTRKLMARFRLPLGAMAVLVALVPQVSSAYKIICVNGYTSFLCNDGTKSICTAGGHQFDCPEQNGDRQCASHGGLKAIITDYPTAVVDYLGKFDLSGMQCTDCSRDAAAPVVYATWIGSCGDISMTCSEMDPKCDSKQATFKAVCAQLRQTITTAWYLDLPPQNACYESSR